MVPVSVLLIDDDTELCTSLARLLALEGFAATAIHDASHAVLYATDPRFALVILDVMLPGGDGCEVLRTLRQSSNVPVIMLTARGAERERILGLEAGADDYLGKPFSPGELIARMRAVLRRRSPAAATNLIRVGDLELHAVTRRVLCRQQEIALTEAEFNILLLLLREHGKPVSRERLTLNVFDRALGPFDRSVDNHVSNLRRKLGASAEGEQRIRSVRGTGYVYVGEDHP